MVGVAQDDERNVSSLAACIEINTEESAPGTALCQHRVRACGVIGIAGDVEEEGLKV
jgi:hypothetical protein